MDNDTLKQFSDTSKYTLMILISDKGVRICFDPADASALPVTAVTETWGKGATDNDGSLLARIEKVIYDHPEVLDDYSAQIIIATDMMLAFPSQFSDEGAATCMNKVYACEAEDVMTEDCGRVMLVFTLTPGLKSFIDRTFPGARVRHAMSEMMKRYGADTQRQQRAYAHIEDETLSMLAFEDKRLMHISVHEAHEAADAVYYIFMLMQELGYYADEAEVFVSGPKALRQELAKLLRRNLNYVSYTPLPPCFDDDTCIFTALPSAMARKS